MWEKSEEGRHRHEQSVGAVTRVVRVWLSWAELVWTMLVIAIIMTSNGGYELRECCKNQVWRYCKVNTEWGRGGGWHSDWLRRKCKIICCWPDHHMVTRDQSMVTTHSDNVAKLFLILNQAWPTDCITSGHCVPWSWDWVPNIFRTRLRSVQCSCPKTCEECKSLLTQETQYYSVPLLTTLALNKMLQNKYKSVTIRQHVFMRTQQNRSWMFVPELVEMVDLFVTIFLDSCQIAPDTCHCTWDWGWHGSMTRWQPPSYWQSASSVHWVFLPPVFPPHCLHWWSCRMLDWQWVASG